MSLNTNIQSYTTFFLLWTEPETDGYWPKFNQIGKAKNKTKISREKNKKKITNGRMGNLWIFTMINVVVWWWRRNVVTTVSHTVSLISTTPPPHRDPLYPPPLVLFIYIGFCWLSWKDSRASIEKCFGEKRWKFLNFQNSQHFLKLSKF